MHPQADASSPVPSTATSTSPLPRLYADLAPWWEHISTPEDYREEAAFLRSVMDDFGVGEGASLLEIGSGGGHLASCLAVHHPLTLVDRSPAMLALSRRWNPAAEHVEGDMRTLRLARSFDVVLLHDAVVYMTRREELQAAVATAYAHTRPGGIALFAPDHVAETFAPYTATGGLGEDEAAEEDGDEAVSEVESGPGMRRGSPPAAGLGTRFLEWAHPPGPGGEHYDVDFVFVHREPDGSVRVEHDRHTFGLYAREVWLALLAEAGFDAHCLRNLEGHDLFVGVRPEQPGGEGASDDA